jgi:prophage regulatory protein
MNSTTTNLNADLQILRLPQVIQVTELCRSMVYQLEAEQRSPRRIKIGQRAVGWLEDEIQAWVAKRVEQSRSRLTTSQGQGAHSTICHKS